MKKAPNRSLIVLAFAVFVITTITIVTVARELQRSSNRQLILMYLEAPPPMVNEYGSLKKGDPAENWHGPGFYLAHAITQCGVKDFKFRIYFGDEIGWSNAVTKEVGTVPLSELSTRSTTCLTRLVDPPHIFASLPDEKQADAVVRHMVQFNPPL